MKQIKVVIFSIFIFSALISGRNVLKKNEKTIQVVTNFILIEISNSRIVVDYEEAELSDIEKILTNKKNTILENHNEAIVTMTISSDTKMGIVTDVKNELRKVGLYKYKPHNF